MDGRWYVVVSEGHGVAVRCAIDDYFMWTACTIVRTTALRRARREHIKASLTACVIDQNFVSVQHLQCSVTATGER